MVEFQFIDYESPAGAKQAAKKRAVKSHAALHHWARDAAARSERRGRGHARARGRAQIFDLALRDVVGTATPNERSDADIEDNRILIHSGCQAIEPLGAARADPFHTYPVEWRPYIPEVVDHYIANMATMLNATTGPCDGALIRTRFFPLAMTDPATFLTVLLLGASDLISIRKQSDVPIDLLRLKQQTIKAINDGLADPSRSCSDAMVGAVAKIGDYEARHGDRNSYMVHMNGLQTMIAMRGGLSNLGLDGIIRALCLWIDRRAASNTGTPRFFQGASSGEPNSERSIMRQHTELLNGDSLDRRKQVEEVEEAEGQFDNRLAHTTCETTHRPVRPTSTPE